MDIGQAKDELRKLDNEIGDEAREIKDVKEKVDEVKETKQIYAQYKSKDKFLAEIHAIEQTKMQCYVFRHPIISLAVCLFVTLIIALIVSAASK